ncbi:MAG: hypothetical protein NC336_06895 [Clostridium sp.]|nr:hypothetical protein [Clostridium sp.]
MKRFSDFLSFIFSPLLVPSYGVALALWFSMLVYLQTGFKLQIVLFVFIITAVIPAALILLLKVFGFVSDIGLNNQKERTLPYCIVCLSYLVTAYYFMVERFPSWIVLFMAGATLAVIISLVVNIWWKISAHLAAMGGAVGLLMRIIADGDEIAATFPMLLTMIVLTGLVAMARVYLGRHTLGQVIAGSLNGAICVFVATALA